MENKKVAIIFSTYNSSEYVSECLKSCLNQSYGEVCVVVSDDGSEDNTIEIIENAAEGYSNFYLISLPHGERGIARAKAIDKALAIGIKYIYIIDSDMILKKDLVSDCVKYLEGNKNVGALVIPEIAFSEYKNYYSKVKVFERNIINNAGEEIGKNSIEAARFWNLEAFKSTGGINVKQISFEEIQPTIRYIEKDGIIKRATFTGVIHNEKYVTLKNILKKKRYYFSVINKTIESEKAGASKAFSRWYFFRPVLYRKDNLKRYIRNPLLTLGVIYMYLALTAVGIYEILKAKVNKN